ncbi:MAG: hypothetical protein QOE92_2421 [Chloroflexota bacterium]|jgi:hypothetical protein|nr:hypothetical protein [Chloroflexota bacterium]
MLVAMPEPTKADADLYLKLFQLTQDGQFTQALGWVLGEFKVKGYADMRAKYPIGGDDHGHLMKVMGFYESVGVLVSRSLLHEDVFYDAPLGFETVWPKIKPLLQEWRAEAKSEAAWENLNWLGMRMDVWQAEVWKPKLEVFPPDKPPEKPEPNIRGFQH